MAGIRDDAPTVVESGRAAALRRYNSSEKGKASRRVNNQRHEAKRKSDPELRAARKAYAAAYSRSDRAKINKARYEAKIRQDPERLEKRRLMQLGVRRRYVAKMRAIDPKWEYKARRERNLQKKYGLGKGEYDALLAAHGNACAICGGKDRLHVDHSHEDGHVRGILCGMCNPALGLLGDNIAGIERALQYLQERC